MPSNEDARPDAPTDPSDGGGRFVDAIAQTEPAPRSFGRAIGGTIAGTVLPGLGLVLGRHRTIGAVVLTTFLGGLLALVLLVVFRRRSLIAWALNPSIMQTAAIILVVAAFAWVGVIILTHVWLRPAKLTNGQRGAGAALVGVLSFLVAAPLAVGSVYATASAQSVGGTFKSHNDSKSATRPSEKPTREAADPWKGVDRVNILLLGGDSDGGNRDGIRTDTVMVASIDPQTGNVTLVSLPRNTGRMPFPEDSVLHEHFPYGFSNGDGSNPEYMLNAMYGNVPAVLGKDILGETDNVGADVMKLSVGEAIGLKIDYYALVDIKGFSQMIDALGGITVNINDRVAVGGSTDANRPPDRWLEPGPDQHLNGNDAMWFARGRYGSDDFERMDRQRCVIDAMVRQVNPANVVSRYEAIVREGGDLILTDITQEDLPAFADLAMRVKDGKIRSLVFKNGERGFFSSDPDFASMRERVKAAIGETKKAKKKSSKPKSSSPADPSDPPSSANPSSPDSSSSDQQEESEDTEDACAYQPV